MSYQLQNTTACKMRDELVNSRFSKKITLSEIRERLYKIELPDWLQSQILQMVNYNQTNRITCAVELAMESAVHRKILDKIIYQGNTNVNIQTQK